MSVSTTLNEEELLALSRQQLQKIARVRLRSRPTAPDSLLSSIDPGSPSESKREEYSHYQTAASEVSTGSPEVLFIHRHRPSGF